MSDAPVFPVRYCDDLSGEPRAVHSTEELLEIAQGVLNECLDLYRDARDRHYEIRITAVALTPRPDRDSHEGDERSKVGWIPDSQWDEHPRFSRADWQYEVVNGDTSLGYIDWVNNQIGLSDPDS